MGSSSFISGPTGCWWQPVPSWRVDQSRHCLHVGLSALSHPACSRIFKLCWGLRLFNRILLPSSFLSSASDLYPSPGLAYRLLLLTSYSPEAPAPINLLPIEFYLDVCFMEDPDQHMLMNSAGLSVPLSILRVSVSEVIPSRIHKGIHCICLSCSCSFALKKERKCIDWFLFKY